MNPLEKNGDLIFKELINRYFTEEEASDIQHLTEVSSINKNLHPKINTEDKRQIEVEFPRENKLVSKIDQTILYAKEKLKRKKFLKFLLSIG